MTCISTTDHHWQKKVLDILRSLAQNRQIITYADLADLAAIPSPHRIHQLAEYLEHLIAEDAKAKRPLRAAVVISKTSRAIPAEGFFDCCEAHFISRQSHEDAAAMHARLLAALYQAEARI
jgi:alkylated DNA nucleotide flippase Atl1